LFSLVVQDTQPVEEFIYNCVVLLMFFGFYRPSLVGQVARLVKAVLGSPFGLFQTIMGCGSENGGR
jgi:hypothetical protein